MSNSASKTRIRTRVTYDTLDDIIKALEATQFPSMTWVAKNYSKEDLLTDLKQLQQNEIEHYRSN